MAPDAQVMMLTIQMCQKETIKCNSFFTWTGQCSQGGKIKIQWGS